MKVRYDLHIHSGLSPCADKEMTPATIAGYAKMSGLDLIAVADHNAIANVEVAIRAGREYGIAVLPAMELQTSEDVHILCLFEEYGDLKAFFETLAFQEIENRPEIFGEQLIFDEDDNVIGRESRLLLASSLLSSQEAAVQVRRFGGEPVPAHIDREANGMVQILGAVTEEFRAVELSSRASPELRRRYAKDYRLLVDSDAHTLADISLGSTLEIDAPTPRALLEYIRRPL